MLSVENLNVEFGATPLFRGATFVINDKERVALVGKNGAGKSTLLKILARQQQPTSGTVVWSNGLQVAYLPQVMILQDEHTVLEEAERAFEHIHEMQARLDALVEQLSERTDYESADYLHLVEQTSSLQERLSLMGAETHRAQIERTLTGLGFRATDFQRPTAEFSGGWRMRIELAKLLLQSPDVLLLDEPTNHLDIESIRWLEQYLQRAACSVVLVSHDRAFINNVTSRTLEISCGKITDYRVKYDEYVRLRAERRESQIRAYENQQKEIADIKDFVERFRYKPTKAVQVQSRLKQLEKMVPIEIDEVDTSSLRLKFPPCQRSGDFPVICDEVGKTYGAHNVFSRVNLTLRRGEKVAFVGRNGEGKSTLVKCIMGEIPFDGVLKLGHNVQIGYYAQNQAQLLDEELTVFDTIDRVARGDVRLKIRDILGAFMFGGEASEKKVKVLSGGERSRLAMIKLLLEPVNFLILDEPTNHLDMRTKDVLREALQAFDGTLIVVSHDRAFLDGLVDKVYAFADGGVREHLGGIYDYLNTLQDAAAPTSLASEKQHQAPVSAAPQKEGKASFEERKEQARQKKKLERLVAEAEQRVMDLEEEKAQVEQQLAEAYSDALTARYAELQRLLAEAEAAWEESLSALEEL